MVLGKSVKAPFPFLIWSFEYKHRSARNAVSAQSLALNSIISYIFARKTWDQNTMITLKLKTENTVKNTLFHACENLFCCRKILTLAVNQYGFAQTRYLSWYSQWIMYNGFCLDLKSQTKATLRINSFKRNKGTYVFKPFIFKSLVV